MKMKAARSSKMFFCINLQIGVQKIPLALIAQLQSYLNLPWDFIFCVIKHVQKIYLFSPDKHLCDSENQH